jgi:hypothetical protein
MTRDDIEHLAEVAESVFAQVRASGPLTEADLDGFVGRMLWAIHMGAKYSHQFRSHLGNPEQ